MNDNLTSKSAIKALSDECDSHLKAAVEYALILFIDNEVCFSLAISKAARTHHIKPMKKIEEIIREVIPDSFIKGRKKHWGNKSDKKRYSKRFRTERQEKRKKAKSLHDFVGNSGRQSI